MGTYGSRSLVGRRHGDREGARQDRRQGQEDRRAPARGGGHRHRVQGRQVHGRRHRPQQDVRRGRAHRLRAAQLSARQARAGPERDGVLRSDQLHLSRRARTSARSRSIPTPAWSQIVDVHRVRRLRQHHQSDDRRGPGARRPRAGHRPGAARELRLRPATAGSCSPAATWTTRCRAPTTCRRSRSAPRSRRARTIRSA